MYSFRIATIWTMVHYFSFLSITSVPVNGASINSTENRNTSESSNSTNHGFDDRLNLNFNIAGAQGFGNNGGFSQANSLSYGANAAIRRPGGYTENLFSNSGANSNGYSSGPGAPLTFANSGSRARPGYAGGNASAGVLGGRGSSYAQSINQNYEIPLDNRGTVLLSNLKERNDTTQASMSPSSDQTTVPTSSSTSKDNGSLIFS